MRKTLLIVSVATAILSALNVALTVKKIRAKNCDQ